ncbi:MAG: AraC family transcriptional regulator [Planctomycetota bacterium]
MERRYQEVYPSQPLDRSTGAVSPTAAQLLTLEYFEAPPGEMPAEVYAQHHVLLNLNERRHRVEHECDGETRDFEIELHDVVVTPAGVRSGWRWHERSRVIVITLEPESLRRFALHELGVVFGGAQLVRRPAFQDEDLCRAGELLLDALRTRAIGSSLLFESLARVFLIKLLQRYGAPGENEAEAGAGLTARHVQKIVDHLAAHFASEVSVDDLARLVSLSKDHFARLFREAVGETPHQFVLSYRVERAKELLVDEGVGLAQVAIRCGFSDQSHFSRVFKRKTGTTPSAFRPGRS